MKHNYLSQLISNSFVLSTNQIPDISIVLPAYNPPVGWTQKTVASLKYLQSALNNPLIEIIVVNDGNKKWDNTARHVLSTTNNLCHFLTHEVNKGKGEALRTGVAAATGKIIVMTDIDWPYTMDSVVNIISSLRNGNDVALGHRDEQYYKDMPMERQVISKVLRTLNARLLNLVSDDTQCGLKGMQQTVKHLFLRTTTQRYLFDLEFVKIVSRKKELKVSIVSVTLRPGVAFTTMRLGVLIIESLNFFKILWSNPE